MFVVYFIGPNKCLLVGFYLTFFSQINKIKWAFASHTSTFDKLLYAKYGVAVQQKMRTEI